MKNLTLFAAVAAYGTLVVLLSSYHSAWAESQTVTGLPDGDGKAIFVTKCNQCHSAEGVVGQRRSADDWRFMVERMIGLGAVLSSEEQRRVNGYLATHFGLPGPAASPPASLPSGAAGPKALVSAQHTRAAFDARLADYLEMPATGDFTVRDARSQVARLNFLVQEPGSGRQFIGDTSGPLYIADKKTKSVVRYLEFNGSNGAKGLFPQFIAEAGYASGLLAATFDPDYRRNGIFYTIHLEDMTSTASQALNAGAAPGLDLSAYRRTNGIPMPSGPAPLIREAVIVEWTDRNIRNTTFEGTAREVMRIQLMNSIHPTDDLSFNPSARRGDPDWRVLYVATGDGGAGEQTDVRRLNPQRLDHLGGKIIRIVPDRRERVSTSTVSENGQYRIPDDNPFASTPGARKEIWANGLRNPHRMAWDGGTLLAFVIGSNGVAPGPRYETIDLVRRGANYGYPLREGPEFKALSPIYGSVPTDNSLPLRISDTVVLDRRVTLQDSALAYKTTVEGNAISNGFVYRGRKWPMLQGMVVFGDITSGRIFYARMADLEAATDGDPKTLAPFGEIKTNLATLAPAQMRVRTPTNAAPSAPPTPAGAGGASPPPRPRPFRIDMRLATDRDGEIYILTKSDGVIRRITEITRSSPS